MTVASIASMASMLGTLSLSFSSPSNIVDTDRMIVVVLV